MHKLQVTSTIHTWIYFVDKKKRQCIEEVVFNTKDKGIGKYILQFGWWRGKLGEVRNIYETRQLTDFFGGGGKGRFIQSFFHIILISSCE